MAWGRAPGPGAVTWARPGGPSPQGRGSRSPRPEKRGSSQDHLEVSWADFCFIHGPAGAVTGIIRWGGAS
jgi:hypothetical protein